MYQSPDLVKVDLDVKDNFAAYSSCYRNSWTAYTNNEQVTSGLCEIDRIVTYASGETDYQCFVNDMAY